MQVRFTRGSRKHKIGRAHALHVMGTVTPELIVGAGHRSDDQLRWIGLDDRGLELEVIALVLPDDLLLVIHVMPTALRGTL